MRSANDSSYRIRLRRQRLGALGAVTKVFASSSIVITDRKNQAHVPRQAAEKPWLALDVNFA